jgi:hypothetical protein
MLCIFYIFTILFILAFEIILFTVCEDFKDNWEYLFKD